MMPETASRPRCSVFIATSLDGHIARPDGSIDWLSAVHVEGEDYGYKAFADTCDTLVVGRNTYDTVLGFEEWPYAGKRVVVLTHKKYPGGHGETFFAGSPADLVHALGREGARRVYVDGGAVIQQFLAAGLIDDLTISLVPVMLGAGIPLFAAGAPEQRLLLEGSHSWPSGLVQLRYRVAR
jgi:dihydrofolate reductase